VTAADLHHPVATHCIATKMNYTSQVGEWEWMK